MKLVRLIYWSRSAQDISLSLIESIRPKATEFNKSHYITGFLTFGNKHFLQALEGDSAVVNELYGRIAKDRRHSQVTLVDYRAISERAFGQWSIGIADLHGLEESHYLRVAPSPVFNPQDLTADGALSLLQSLTETLQSRRREAAAAVAAITA